MQEIVLGSQMVSRSSALNTRSDLPSQIEMIGFFWVSKKGKVRRLEENKSYYACYTCSLEQGFLSVQMYDMK